MTEAEKQILDFSSKAHLLINKYKELKKENENLEEKLKASEKRIQELSLLLTASERDFENLKTAKMLEVSDGDIEKAKARIAKMIRDINKCITLLNNG